MSSITLVEATSSDDACSLKTECTPEAKDDPPPSVFSRDDEWYLEDGNVVLLVEHRLFRLHKFMLTRESDFFRTLLSLPQRNVTSDGKIEGESDDCPIICTGDTYEDFKALCWAIYARAADILAEHVYATSNIPRLVRVTALSHKYNFTAIETWTFGVLSKHAKDYQIGLFAKYGEWAAVGRILNLAVKCHQDALARQIEKDWVSLITDPSGTIWEEACVTALSVAENSLELREFHGKAYYTLLRATSIFATGSQRTLGSENPVKTVSILDQPISINLSRHRWQRLYTGYWSLSCLRVKLAHPPALGDSPPCSDNHVRDCVPAWQAWWKGILDDSARNGKHLNDPGELIQVMEKRITKPIQCQVTGTDIPCNEHIRSQISSMREAFEKSLADRFLGPEMKDDD
ncbi:hypothetical protein D9756_005084 [Leucocoprinus leucothites]|uniref:BTB domain-containing protein n=1 Tax=Leucocoprinus leucothites TaxID=201217 RepID=A0A8H5G8K2_9AGAR|nr:hypothetical protein D9756_005084 [Leucoagaricus leucothites]